MNKNNFLFLFNLHFIHICVTYFTHSIYMFFIQHINCKFIVKYYIFDYVHYFYAGFIPLDRQISV